MTATDGGTDGKGKQWGTTGEKRGKSRRKLLLHARNGDLKAQRKLMDKYGMRVYSETERSELPTYYDSGKEGHPPSLTSGSVDNSLESKKASRSNQKRKAMTKKDSKRSRTS